MWMIQRQGRPPGDRPSAGLVAYAQEKPGRTQVYNPMVSRQRQRHRDRMGDRRGGHRDRQVSRPPTTTPRPRRSAPASGDFGLAQAHHVALQHFQAGRVDVVLVTSNTVPDPLGHRSQRGERWNRPALTFGALRQRSGLRSSPTGFPPRTSNGCIKLIRAGRRDRPPSAAHADPLPGTTFNIRRTGPKPPNSSTPDLGLPSTLSCARSACTSTTSDRDHPAAAPPRPPGPGEGATDDRREPETRRQKRPGMTPFVPRQQDVTFRGPTSSPTLPRGEPLPVFATGGLHRRRGIHISGGRLLSPIRSRHAALPYFNRHLHDVRAHVPLTPQSGARC